MKTKITVAILLFAFIAAVPVEAQSRNERKLKREMAKLEKQMKKVRDLRGESLWFPHENFSKIREYEVKRAHDLTDLYKAQAMREKELALKHAERAKNQYREFYDKAKWETRDASSARWDALPDKYLPKYEEFFSKAMEYQNKAIKSQQEAIERALAKQQAALEKARFEQQEAIEKAMHHQREALEQIKAELEIAKRELEEEKKKEEK